MIITASPHGSEALRPGEEGAGQKERPLFIGAPLFQRIVRRHLENGKIRPDKRTAAFHLQVRSGQGRAFTPYPIFALDSTHLHVKAVQIVNIPVLDAVAVKRVFGHRLLQGSEGRRLVHVDPKVRRMQVVGQSVAPPIARLGRGEIHPGRLSRPTLA